MNNSIVGTDVKCLKTLDDLGYPDFIEGKYYWVESMDEDSYYIESEDGSCVMFEFDEAKECFNI